MSKRMLSLVISVLFSVGVLAGCGQAEEAARNIGDQARDAATAAATQAAKDELCRMIADGKLSDDERTTLRAALDAAERAGADPTLIATARDAERNAGALTPSQVTAVQQQCAPTTSTTAGN